MEKIVFNLIILDESGSMSSSREATISGCNENLNIIRSLQKEDTQDQRFLTSIYVFQGENPKSPSHYIHKNVAIDKVKDITENDYKPWGSTPLLDAIGKTVTELIDVAATHEDASASITIITDGYENSSKEYSHEEISRLLSRVKEMGWNVNLIGANIDVDQLGDRLNIKSRMSYTSDMQGTQVAWKALNRSARVYHKRRSKFMEELDNEHPNLSEEEKRARRVKFSKSLNDEFFES